MVLEDETSAWFAGGNDEGWEDVCDVADVGGADEGVWPAGSFGEDEFGKVEGVLFLLLRCGEG